MEPERNVEAQDDARQQTGFPSKKERRAKRKKIISLIKKYSTVYDLRQRLKRLEREKEEITEADNTSELIEAYEEAIRATTNTINSLVDPKSEDPGIEKPRFFFLRDKKDRPVVCICDQVYSGRTYRGIAIASSLEFEVKYPDGKQKFCKASGRKIAFDRAIAAIMMGVNGMPVLRPEPKEVLESAGVPQDAIARIVFKAQADTTPTDGALAAAYKPRK